MIKTIDCSKKNYLTKLVSFLEKRRNLDKSKLSEPNLTKPPKSESKSLTPELTKSVIPESKSLTPELTKSVIPEPKSLTIDDIELGSSIGSSTKSSIDSLSIRQEWPDKCNIYLNKRSNNWIALNFSEGYEIYDVPPDGNCFFYSFAHLMELF